MENERYSIECRECGDHRFLIPDTDSGSFRCPDCDTIYYEVNPREGEDPIELVYSSAGSLLDTTNYTIEEWEKWMQTEIEVRLNS
jgi:hypothetical protein